MFTQFGFARVAAAVPAVRVADPAHNTEQVLKLLDQADEEGCALAVFPELCLTGYTCGDLFQHRTLLDAATAALAEVLRGTGEHFRGVAVVGLPLAVDGALFNCAAVLHRGTLLGVVPKSYLPNYKEFYEDRWFTPAALARSNTVRLCGQEAWFGPGQLFAAADVPGFVLGVEVCEDLWGPIPPSAGMAVRGATLLANLSASNEVIGKAAYRRQLVAGQSGRCTAAYVYTSCGVHESTSDVVFGGHCLVAENGTVLAESRRFERGPTLLVADVDLDRLAADRLRAGSFGDTALYQSLRRQEGPVTEINLLNVPAVERLRERPLLRYIDSHPFVPKEKAELRERCEEIFNTQVAGLAKRLEHVGTPPLAIGVSGGLDSTLALLVACKTLDLLKKPRTLIRAWTLPGFGTTTRTKANAVALMKHLGVTAAEADIRQLCLEELRLLGHKPFGIDPAGLDVEAFTAKLRQVPAEKRHDLVFENVQARMRTNILMNAGFVVGTGDLSELALGWTTYNGDHMSMYNPNVSIPKTLVKFLVRWAAENEFEGQARQTLLDIAATQISPELLPLAEGEACTQATEDSVGPYELQDFYLYHFLRFGTPPEKLLFMASQAKFDHAYSRDDLRRWLQVFLRRFFANQFKRSCLPDGPKVGTVAISPRGDLRMPSDAQATAWLAWAEEV